MRAGVNMEFVLILIPVDRFSQQGGSLTFILSGFINCTNYKHLLVIASFERGKIQHILFIKHVKYTWKMVFVLSSLLMVASRKL